MANNIGTDVKQADIDIAKMKTVDAAGAATAVNATGWGTVATDANQAAINNWGYSATTGKLSSHYRERTGKRQGRPEL